MDLTQDNVLDVSVVPFEGDFEEQVEQLLAYVRLSRDQVENMQVLLDDLIRTLEFRWPHIRLHPFGSIITGLGIKTSDVDCFAEIPLGYSQCITAVNYTRKVLTKDKSRYTQTFAITAAKVPIVKFHHIPTGFSCDLNFSSFGGVRNSKLIAFLLNQDPRALKLAVIIKYWSKMYSFTGTNLLASYALTMMVILYLQVKSVLPSVEELQRSGYSHWVDGWDTAFDHDYQYQSDNCQSLHDLLGGFFDYYNTFNYDQFAITPYLGYPVKKDLFLDIDNLPFVYRVYQKNVESKECEKIKLGTPICIQDPFDHSRNCSGAVSIKLFNKIRAHIELACKIFEDNPEHDVLKLLFTMNVPGPSQVVKKDKPKKNKQKGVQKRRAVQKEVWALRRNWLQNQNLRQFHQGYNQQFW